MSSPPRIDLLRLPETSGVFVGREAELARLDAAWDAPGVGVISLVAFGGVGKTALVKRWLAAMAAAGFRGAEGVYGWSFYSQGTGDDRTASADLFVDQALRFFGDWARPATAACVSPGWCKRGGRSWCSTASSPSSTRPTPSPSPGGSRTRPWRRS